jgi:hypothetical protein
MTPALNYLIRTNLIKDWFSPPCSLFLYKENYEKFVITISEEFKPSSKFSVKHWRVGQCNSEQALPSMNEFCVPKDMIYRHPAVFVAGCRLISWEHPIKTEHNSFKSPMMPSLYYNFFDFSIENQKELRMNWLWDKFVRIYAPDICILYNESDKYSWPYPSRNEIIEKQRNAVCLRKKREWKYWILWQQHMLLNPAEFVFHKEYAIFSSDNYTFS